MQKIVYSTSTEEKDNISMIDYLASEGCLQGNELKTAKDIIQVLDSKRAYQAQ